MPYQYNEDPQTPSIGYDPRHYRSMHARNYQPRQSWFSRLSPEERTGLVGAGAGAAVTGLLGRRFLPAALIGAGGLYAAQRYFSKESAAAQAPFLQQAQRYIQQSPLLASAGAGAAMGALTAPDDGRVSGAASGALYGTLTGLLMRTASERYAAKLAGQGGAAAEALSADPSLHQMFGAALGGAYAGRTTAPPGRRMSLRRGGPQTGFDLAMQAPPPVEGLGDV